MDNYFRRMDRQERLTHIIHLLQDLSLNSMEMKARFPGVSPRTIERDLEQLAQEGRIHQVSRERSRNPTWETSERAPTIEVRWMNGRTAAAVRLMEGCLSCILPNQVLQDLQPLFERAENTLKQAQNHEYATWTRKIHIWPTIKEKNTSSAAIVHLETIQEALLNNKTLQLTLVPSFSVAANRRIHPQGLVFSPEGMHLLATSHDDHHVMRINLNDIRDVQLENVQATTPATFDLDAIIQVTMQTDSGPCTLPMSSTES